LCEFVSYFLLICIVVVTVPLVAVLLNCPYPDPPVSDSFFSFSSASQRGEGRPRGAFVAGGSRNQNTDKCIKPGGLWLWYAHVLPLLTEPFSNLQCIQNYIYQIFVN